MTPRGSSGVENQMVESTELLDCCFDQPFGVFGVGNVSGNWTDAPIRDGVYLRCRILEAFFRPSVDDDVSPLCSEGFRSRFSKTALEAATTALSPLISRSIQVFSHVI